MCLTGAFHQFVHVLHTLGVTHHKNVLLTSYHYMATFTTIYYTLETSSADRQTLWLFVWTKEE